MDENISSWKKKCSIKIRYLEKNCSKKPSWIFSAMAFHRNVILSLFVLLTDRKYWCEYTNSRWTSSRFNIISLHCLQCDWTLNHESKHESKRSELDCFDEWFIVQSHCKECNDIYYYIVLDLYACLLYTSPSPRD